MISGWQQQLSSGATLRGIVQQATVALIAMDAGRLEELAICCADLNREPENLEEFTAAPSSLADAGDDLALLRCILHETRANLTVLTRLHTIRLREAILSQNRTDDAVSNTEAEAFHLWNRRERTPDYGDN
jgi:hypothetical protein